MVLFPVRLDDAVLTTKAAWAAHLRRTRHIGDFRAWEDHDPHPRTLERLLHDLRVRSPATGSSAHAAGAREVMPYRWWMFCWSWFPS